MIRALIFDFDGLILDTETPVLTAWEAMHREAGLVYPQADATKLVGHVDIPFDPWTAFDPQVDRTGLEREHRRRAREILAAQQVRPGVLQYLEEAKRLRLRAAVASNSTHPWIDHHLERLGLAGYFELTRCREDVARGKPEPDVYQAVLDAFGISGPEAIAFEDSEAGSHAAKRAQVWCVAVPNPSTHRHRFEHVDLQITSMADQPLGALLERWA